MLMLDKIIAWLCGSAQTDKIMGEINLLIDQAYVDGARHERKEVLAIMDRLNTDFCEVHNCVCRQAREEIAHRSC
jgi:hypothetical protein